MLQSIHNKMHGWPFTIVMGICVLAMSLFGIESYFTSHSSGYVAKVGDQEITQADYQARTNELRQQFSSEQGDHFDPTMFDKPAVKQQILGGLVDQKILLQANSNWGMRVPDQAVRDYIASLPAFQINNQFDPTTYRTLLEAQNKTPEQFQDEVRASLAAQVIPDAINDSTIVSPSNVDGFLSLAEQKRDLSYFVLPKPALKDTQVTDAQIAAYYKAHLADYTAPEQVSVQYVEVDANQLPQDAAPTDDALKKRYDDEKQKFVQPEQREVSHILVNVPANATPAQQKAALAKADQIVAQATPANFAQLARQDSDDLGSKLQGGDLGWLQKGVTNPAFDNATFALQKGQISKPVLSPDGYHIIWLRDIRSGESKPFAEVRDQLLKEATASARDHAYNDIAGKLADQAYSNPSSLEPAANALHLPIKTTVLFSRQGGDGPAANSKFVKAAFSDDVLVQGNNSDRIELDKDHSVVLHLDKHVAAAPRPLPDVRAQIQKNILDERALAAEKAEADRIVTALQKGGTMQNAATAANAKLEVAKDAARTPQPQQPASVPAALLKQAFLMPHPSAGQPQYAAVDMQDGSYAVVALVKVQPGDLSKLPAEERNALQQEMAQAYGAETTNELIAALKAKTKIVVNNSQL